MAEETVIKAKGIYNGHSAKSNFDVDLKFIFTEENLPGALNFISGIGKRLRMVTLVGDKKVDLGYWNVYKFMVDHNCQAKVTFKSNRAETFPDRLPDLMEEDQEIIIKAKIVD